MFETLQKFYDVSKYKNTLARQEALFIYVALTTLMVLVSIFFVFIPDARTPNNTTQLQSALAGDLLSLFNIVFFYIFSTVIFVSTQRGNLDIGNIGIPILFYILAIVPVLLTDRNMIDPVNSLSLGIVIILGGLFMHERGLIVGAIIALLTLLYNVEPEYIRLLPLIVIQFSGISVLVFMYIRYAKYSRDEGAEAATTERLKMANITTEIGSLTLQRSDMTSILKQGLNLIQVSYPQFYHAQVFLLDETGRNAQLVSSTGEVGRALIQRQHSIGVGSQSVIGQATLRNAHVISKATDPNTIHKRNEFLPDTLVEVAFPLRLGNKVIGALDLQSKEVIELDETALFTFQSLANSFALAIDNVRQFESAEARIAENQRLAEQASQSLHEIDRLNKRLMEQAWSEYMAGQPTQLGLNIDFENNTIEESGDWSDSLKQVIQDGNMVQTDQSNEQLITIPLKIRGQVIGAMEFELDENNNIDPSDLTLIQEVSERFGLAAENTRLVEESQRVAQREALISEIGSRLQSTNNVESTLTEAARSIGSVLNANRVSIRLSKPEQNTLTNEQL